MRRFVFLLPFFLAAPAMADEAYDKCIDTTSSNTEWAECGAALLKREDDRLNVVWKRVYAIPDEKTRADLLAEQRSWNAYKEKSCLLFANGEWGREGQVLHYPACRAEVIAERTKALQAYGEFFQPK